MFTLFCDFEKANFGHSRGCREIITNMRFLELFGRLKSVVIGMIHVKALPGITARLLRCEIISEICTLKSLKHYEKYPRV